VKGDAVAAVPVTRGIETPELSEVIGDLQPGDTLVLDGGYGLPDGAHVKVRP